MPAAGGEGALPAKAGKVAGEALGMGYGPKSRRFKAGMT
jgi:hypothetical protein